MALSTAWPTLPPPLKIVESILNKALDSHVVKKMTFNLVWLLVGQGQTTQNLFSGVGECDLYQYMNCNTG